jgi:Helicase associated domain
MFHAHESLSLNNWIVKQRQLFKKNKLSQHKIDKLNSIGFAWDWCKSAWDKAFERLLIYKKKHGTVNVNQTTKRKNSLQNWVDRQRRDFRKKIINQDRIDKLNSVGFNWSPKLSLWNKNFENLLIFKKKYHHTDVSKTNKDFKLLAHWVSSQRHFFRKGILPQDKIDKLNSIDFIWDRKERTWDESFDELLSFKKKHGHVNIPQKYKKDSALGSWISRQRMLFKANTLPQDKIDKLNSIGFIWKFKE